MRFEWDEKKQAANIAKHGVSFFDAQRAFADPHRYIAADEKHSRAEPRLYCIGSTPGGIMTVRFTARGGTIRIIGAGYWRKGRKLYEKENNL